MKAHPGKENRAKNLAIAYSMKKRAKMARGGMMAQCPACLSMGGRCDAHADNKPYAQGGKIEAQSASGMYSNRSAERYLDNEAHPHPLEPHGSADYSAEHGMNLTSPSLHPDRASGSPTEDVAAAAVNHNDSPAQAIMKRRKDRGSAVGRYAQGGYVDSSEDDLKSEHDYSMLPEGHDASTTGAPHDSDETDRFQQESLVGQIIKKRKQMKR